jgi:muconolactone delta-isomerase
VALAADRIVWAGEGEGWSYFERAGKPHILFRRRGNKYANWLELMSNDVAALEQIRSRFPLLFKADVVKQEGNV